MFTDLLYRCPCCGSFDWYHKGRCTACGVRVKLLSRNQVEIDGHNKPLGDWYDLIRALPLPSPRPDGTLFQSGRVRLSCETRDNLYRGHHGVVAGYFSRRKLDTGNVRLTAEKIHFRGASQDLHLYLHDMVSATIESDTLIVVTRTHGAWFLDFLDESGKQWEDCLQAALRAHHAPREIVEFCPRITFADRLCRTPHRADPRPLHDLPVARWRCAPAEDLCEHLRTGTRSIVTRILSGSVVGLEHIPAKGGAILMCNHSSFLDAVILALLPKRKICFMTKNSQAENPLLRRFLVFARAFPVRRYTTDVQAVRNAMRIVQQGHILGLFPEGERCWDSRPLPYKRGAMRLVLTLGVPVIPVGIEGAYDLMPRWSTRITPGPVHVRIGKPMRFDRLRPSAQREHDITAVTQAIAGNIHQLTGAPA